MDWSDHAMWWPDRNIWLDKTRWTLDQYNITADAVTPPKPTTTRLASIKEETGVNMTARDITRAKLPPWSPDDPAE